jgi:hypothetical protein
MRTVALMWVSLFMILSTLPGRPEEPDPYWTDIIKFEFKMNENGQRVISSWSQRILVQLGDRAAVSILKILEPAEVKDPEKIKASLFIIRQAFAAPQSISLEVDKDPRVTLFLLEYWKQNINDPKTQDEVQETLRYVQEQVRSLEPKWDSEPGDSVPPGSSTPRFPYRLERVNGPTITNLGSFN